MTVLELPALRSPRRTPVEGLVLSAAAGASAVVARRIARRSERVAAVFDTSRVDADRAAAAGARAHGLLPR